MAERLKNDAGKAKKRCRKALKIIFRESTLGNTFIVHDDTKKDKFHSDGALRHPLRADLQNELQLMASTYIARLIFDKCRRIPNRKLISHTVKELFGWRRKAA